MTLATQLHQLERSQLVRHTDQALMAYIFKHVLVQETAYSSLLKGDRQRLHHAVAECIERAEPDRLDENAARLEQHYAASGEYARALEFARRAGAYAMRMFANTEAIEHFTLALDLLTQYGGSADEFRSVYLERGRALQETGAYERALENYHALETLGRTNNDASLELAGLVERATLHAIPSTVQDPKLCAALNAQALALARALGDRRAECKTLWNLLLLAYFDVEPGLAVEYGERALALARELGWQELEAYILNDICRPLISIGPPERVLTLLEQARVLFVNQNNLPLLADNLAATAQANAFYGNYETSRAFEEQAVQLSRTIGNAWALAYSRFSSIAFAASRGQLARVSELIQELKKLPADAGGIMIMYGTRGWLAEIQRVLGDYEGALEYSSDLAAWVQENYHLGRAWSMGNVVLDLALTGQLDEGKVALARAHQEKLHDFYSFGPISVGTGEAELALALGDPAWALRVTTELIAKLEQLGIQFYLPGMYALHRRALLLQGALDKAAAAFTQMRELGERIPARKLLWETFVIWAELEAGFGNAPQARALRTQAAEYVVYIADEWDTPARRKQFLDAPRVRALFDSIALASP